MYVRLSEECAPAVGWPLLARSPSAPKPTIICVEDDLVFIDSD
jgi:hypothetical protein